MGICKLTELFLQGVQNVTKTHLCLQDAFASERRKAKMLNFSIAYGKTTVGLARDWKVFLQFNLGLLNVCNRIFGLLIVIFFTLRPRLSRGSTYHLYFQVSLKEAEETVKRWYSDRKEVLNWQELRKKEAREKGHVHTLLGRARKFPSASTYAQRGHIERAAINTPVQVREVFMFQNNYCGFVYMTGIPFLKASFLFMTMMISI